MDKEFKPTYLCIKEHVETGLKYLCRTQKQHKEMLKYKGSGDYWKDHLKKHGKDSVETLWYCLFYDKESIQSFSLRCSDQWDIVNLKDTNGKKMWANERPENGVDGAVKDNKQTQDHIDKRSKSMKNVYSLMSKEERSLKHGHPGTSNPMFGSCSVERAKI